MLNKLAQDPSHHPIVFGGRRGAVVHNFRLDDFLTVNRKLAEFREILNRMANRKVQALDGEAVKSVWWLRDQLFILGLGAAYDVERAADLLDKPEAHCSVIVHCLDEAIRSIDYQVRTEWTYHYGRQTPNISNYEHRWAKVLKAFPGTRFEIESALDLFALQHYTASVFHFMRLAEYGLRALASELSVSLPNGKPLTHANWQDIMNHCDKQVKQIAATAPAGAEKDEALAFYSGALSHLHYLKSNFRNDVMHARTQFDVDQAVNASRGAKALMDLLASKLSEKAKKKKGVKDGKIDWGF
jgi:hypothetical protein